MKFYIVLAFALYSAVVHASCQKHPFTDPTEINLNSDSVLLVTHASATYDPRFSSKRGVDEATSFARIKGIPVVYLQDNTPEQDYFMEDCTPDYRVFSENGELSFEVTPSRVYVAGGHLEQCLYSTVQDLLHSWAKQQARNLTLTYLMNGIYSNGELVQDTDAYYRDFDLFMRALTYRRSDADPWPKVTLLESLGMINREDREIEYLRRTLPNFEGILPPDYRVELQLNDSAVTGLQGEADEYAPTLRFHFVDSAFKLDAL
jgi:hypothetical protein